MCGWLPKTKKWGISSSGRAPALQAGGDRFESGMLHSHSKSLQSCLRHEQVECNQGPVDKRFKSPPFHGGVTGSNPVGVIWVLSTHFHFLSYVC